MGGQKTIALRLLGAWEASLQGHSVQIGPRQQRLLAVLAVHGPRPRCYLSGLLWPECTEAHGLGSLRAAVFALSRRLPGAVVCRGTALALSEEVDVDLHHLLDLLARPVAEWSPERDDRWLLERAGMELLPGWYDDWVLEEQERLHDLYVNAVEDRAEHCLELGDVHRALALARTLRDVDPLRESAVRLVIRAHLALGNEADAWRAFRGFRAVLARELGTEPSPRVRNLLEPLRRP
jgi:SARP family transcriptional regulator, regulator of embCAB operon